MKQMLALSLLLLVLSGCRDYTDTNDMLIAAGASLDLGENGETRAAVEVLSFDKSDGAEAQSHVIRGAGDTVFDAFNDLLKRTGKQLFWQHATVLVLGRAYAERGTQELFDYILNNHELRLTLDLAVSSLEKGEDVFSLDPVDRKITSFALDRRIYEAEKLGSALRSPAFSAIDRSLGGLRDFALPLVRAGEDGVMEVSGCAVFRENVMCGTIDAAETQFVQLADSTLSDMALTFDTKDLQCAVSIGQPECECVLSPGEDALDIRIHAKAQFEVMMCLEKVPLSRQERMQRIKSLGEARLAQLFEASQRHFEDLDCDLFGWSERLFRQDPEAFGHLCENGRLKEPPKVRIRVDLEERTEGLPGETVDGEGG